MYDLNLLYYSYWSKCWYLSLKTVLEYVGDENRPKFFNANFYTLKINISLTFFCIFMGKIKCNLCFKKTGQKIYICLWNRSKSIALWSGPKSLCSRRLFECPLAVQSASPQMWKVFTVNWATPWVRAAGETDARHSVSSQLVKYNIIGATIFMTFRTEIHTKKFGKKGFRNLQGTMPHRPLTNTSSL